MSPAGRDLEHDLHRLVEGALDLFVYAPLGVAAMLVEDLDSFAERGRAEAERRTRAARLVGQFSMGVARSQAQRRVGILRSRLEQFAWGPPAGEPQAEQASAPAPPPPAGPARRSQAPAAGAEALPIPGYDTLSASHVVQRLSALSAEDLDVIEAYESAHRARRTVLTKIAQLRSAKP